MKSFEPRFTVNDIKVVERHGPWQSKSGGALDVLMALSQEETEAFLDFENPEFAYVQEDSGKNIRGLRSYSVRDIPKGSIGGQEWHRARTECLIALSGSALWQCTDLYGNTAEFTIDNRTAILTPPGIMHTYTALEDGTRLQVICNTLFIPDDPRTHDSFDQESFDKARQEISAR